jgi:hypothetical protein
MWEEVRPELCKPWLGPQGRTKRTLHLEAQCRAGCQDGAHKLLPVAREGEARKVSVGWVMVTTRSPLGIGTSPEGDGDLEKTRERLGKNLLTFCVNSGGSFGFSGLWFPHLYDSGGWGQESHDRNVCSLPDGGRNVLSGHELSE